MTVLMDRHFQFPVISCLLFLNPADDLALADK